MQVSNWKRSDVEAWSCETCGKVVLAMRVNFGESDLFLHPVREGLQNICEEHVWGNTPPKTFGFDGLKLYE